MGEHTVAAGGPARAQPLRPSPVRTLVVWCRDWPVIAVGAGPTEPAAVVVANRVVAATPAARAGGVRRHHRRREAQARCPDLVVLDRDEAAEARAFEPVLRAVEAFTPRFELTRPGLCTLATRGPSRYFGGDAALADAVQRAVAVALDELGWPGAVAVGVADGAFAAALAARRARPVQIVAPGGTPAFLASLPVRSIDRPELTAVLDRLGIRTLGALAALDPAAVLARFGTDGLLAHRLASTGEEHPPALADPPPELVVTTELDPPAERVDVAAFAAKALADDLLARLDDRGLSCLRLTVVAETEHGESLTRCWRHEGALGAAAVADRVRWQLEGWLNGPSATRPTSGITTLRLVPDQVVPADGRQLGFWGGETAAGERAARALARVAGLLGPDAVAVPELRGGRSPADRVALVPAGAVDLTADRPAARPGWVAEPWPGQVPAPAPATVLPEPIEVEVADDRGRPVRVSGRAALSAPPASVVVAPGVRRAVRAWAGPWPVEERWWDAARSRRRARLQVVVEDPRVGERALLLHVERGRWWVEAAYD